MCVPEAFAALNEPVRDMLLLLVVLLLLLGRLVLPPVPGEAVLELLARLVLGLAQDKAHGLCRRHAR